MEKTREGVLRFQRIMLESERLKLEDLVKKLSEELDRLSRPQSLEEIILQTVGDEQCVEIDLPSILGGREARIEEIKGELTTAILRMNKVNLDLRIFSALAIFQREPPPPLTRRYTKAVRFLRSRK